MTSTGRSSPWLVMIQVWASPRLSLLPRSTLGCRRSVGGRLSHVSRRRTSSYAVRCRINPYLDQGRACGAPAVPARWAGPGAASAMSSRRLRDQRPGRPRTRAEERWATHRLWAAACRAPSGGSPTGAAPRGAARRLAGPHPQVSGAGRNAARCQRLRDLAGPSSAPGILLPTCSWPPPTGSFAAVLAVIRLDNTLLSV